MNRRSALSSLLWFLPASVVAEISTKIPEPVSVPGSDPSVISGLRYRPYRCSYCGADTWCESRANGAAQCRLCQAGKFFEKVLGIYLSDPAKAELRNIMSINQATGLRAFVTATIDDSRILFAGLALYFIWFDAKERTDVYCFVGSKAEAEIIFRSVEGVISKAPYPDILRRFFKILPGSKKISRRDRKGQYCVSAFPGEPFKRPTLAVLSETEPILIGSRLSVIDAIIQEAKADG